MTEDHDALALKITFEDVLRNQTKLRKLLCELSAEDRCLTVTERDGYFDLLARSTFGIGIHKMFSVKIPGVGLLDIDNTEAVARWLGRQTVNPVVVHRMGAADLPPVSMGFLWSRLLDLLDGVFAQGLNLAIMMSKEREKSGGGTGYEFDWER